MAKRSEKLEEELKISSPSKVAQRRRFTKQDILAKFVFVGKCPFNAPAGITAGMLSVSNTSSGEHRA